MRTSLLALLVSYLMTASALAQTAPTSKPAVEFDRQRDVIYGRSWGTSLTMDVFTPKQNRNGLGLILVVSGGWFSSPDVLNSPMIAAFNSGLLQRGYTIFGVCHGSQPKFTVPEAVADMNRAVRYIRAHAADYKIDPDQIGIFGGSAGGHLSLMVGCGNQPEKKDGADPIEKVSSKVQCVAAFFPPTDFLNYGGEGILDLQKGVLAPFWAAFDFREYDDKTKRMLPVENAKRIVDIYREISPLHQVDKNDPPILIIHGDKDVLVPYQQATAMTEKLKSAGVENKLVTREGQGHGWGNVEPDLEEIAKWFDAHLKAKDSAATKP